MATIVQPYNPWREQLALTALGKVAGDIIGDIWNTHKQNEQNRKANAFRGALQQEVGNIAQQQDISLTPKEVPQGYNSNPWANAFHQNNSPITQFDIGTSQRQPTIQDIAKIADNLAATPRFSALSPEVMQGVKNSMIQSNIANMFGNADNWGDKINAWGLGVANGLMPYQPMSALSQLYLHDNPHYDFSNVDIGTHNLTVARNPKDGTASPVLISPVGMSAYQRASLQTQRDIANIHARTQNYATDTNFKAEQIRGQSAAEAARYKFMSDILDKYNKGVDDEIAQLRTQLESAPDEQSAAYFQQQIDALTQQKKQYNDAFMSSFGLGSNQSAATENVSDLGDLSYKDDTSNGIGKDTSGKTFDYSPLINKYSKQYGIDPDFAAAVMQWESGGDPNALSPQGAVGLFQLMPKTAKGLGVNPHNVEDNIKGGIMYLAQLRDKYNGNHELILRGYNAGPGATDAGRYPDETKKYVPGVLGIYRKYKGKKQTQQNTPQVTATGNLNTQTQNTQPQKAKTPAQGNQGGIPYLVKDGDMLTLEAFDKIREQGNYDPETLFNILTEQKGWQLATSQSTPKVTAINEMTQTPQNNANIEPVTPTVRSPQPITLRGGLQIQTQNPMTFTDIFRNVRDWINAHQNNENPFGRPPVSALSYSLDPRNKPHYYFPGNVWQGLTPNIFSDLIDGEYIFLDPRMH